MHGAVPANDATVLEAHRQALMRELNRINRRIAKMQERLVKIQARRERLARIDSPAAA